MEQEESRIGPFVVREELEAGLATQLFSVVYRPEHALMDMGLDGATGAMNTGSNALLKIQKEEFKTDENFQRAVDYESQLLALLDHPRILRSFAKGIHEDRKWIALEHVEGISLQRLRDYLFAEGQRLSPELVIHFILQLSDALATLHALSIPQLSGQWIVHGGVSPSRILIDFYGSFHLLDFSLMRTAVYQPQFDFQKTTFFYQSPEMVKQQQIGRQTDIYSLGLLAFELATGQSIQSGQSHEQDSMDFLQSEPTLHWAENVDIPEFLQTLISRMTEPNWAKRFSDATVLRQYIEERYKPTQSAGHRMAKLVRAIVFTPKEVEE